MNLLILDIDETLLFAAEKPLDRSPDYHVGPFNVYLRPHLHEFLRIASSLFDIAVWTSSNESYAQSILEILPFPTPLAFAWARPRCTPAFNLETREQYFIKDLKKLKRKGFDLDRVLIVDDSPEKLSRNYGNYLRVSEFLGDPSDSELLMLSQYLPILAECKSIRSVDKRGWRSSMEGS